MSQQPAFIKRSSFNEKNVLVSAKEVKQDVNRSKQTSKYIYYLTITIS